MRKALERFAARDEARRERVAEDKPGGHGDHWGCVLRAAEQDDLLALIGDVVQHAERPEVFQANGPAFAVHAGGEKVSACVLVVNNKIVSAYPETLHGEIWPVTVREVVPWSNGIEGQITGECYGVLTSFFDTRFFANRRKYSVGETYEFSMSAFAYKLGRAEDVEFESNLGAKVSLKGAHALMPANIGNDSADIDDYWFHSALEGAAEEAELAGRKLSMYPVIVAVPEHFEMHLDLYAAPHVLAPEMANVGPGEDMDGFLWLQGCLRA